MQSWLKNTVRFGAVVSLILMSSIAQGGVMLRPALTGGTSTTPLHAPTMNSEGGGFDIVLSYSNAPSAAELAAFESAEATWESIIVGLKDGITDQSLEINVNLAPIDEEGGVLGSAGPTSVKWRTADPNYLYSDSGSMTFDTADIPSMAASGILEMVILHEMAHVIGFGTLWSSSGVVEHLYLQELCVDGTGEYTGANGLSAFQQEFVGQGAATYVPVELGGGSGTADGHWNEGDGGITTGILDTEGRDMNLMLMSGWANPGSHISETTIGQWEDLGYEVVPEPSTMILLVLGSTMLLTRRKRAA